jgi:hypothetical protein
MLNDLRATALTVGSFIQGDEQIESKDLLVPTSNSLVRILLKYKDLFCIYS